MQIDSSAWCSRSRLTSPGPRRTADTRAAVTAESTAVCDQQPQPPRAQVALSGAQRLRRATDRRPLPARKLVDGYAQFAQTCRASASGIVDACGPGSPDSHRVVWGLTSRPPVSLAGFPPVSRLPAGFSPVARLPLVSLRPAFSGSSPSAVARVPVPLRYPSGSLPLSNLHDSAAEGRFRRRWSRAARAKVTSPVATTPRLDLAVIRPALQMGNGRARCDAATESPGTSGREHRTTPRPNRSDRRVGARLSGDLFVSLAALSSPGYRPMDGQPSRIFIHRRA